MRKTVAISLVVGRCWSFGDGRTELPRLLAMVRSIAFAIDSRVDVKIFDGRRIVSMRVASEENVGVLLPPKFCWLGAKLPKDTALKGSPDARFYSFSAEISPTSKLWATPARRARATRAEFAMAMTFRSSESYVRHQAIRRMPHCFEFYIEVNGREESEALITRVMRSVHKMLKSSRGRTSLCGGIDFVARFTEMGSIGLKALSPLPAAWCQLRSHFDDMHKIMFGRATLFDSISEDTKTRAFQLYKQIQDERSSYVLAVARTVPDNNRQFVHRIGDILISRDEVRRAVDRNRRTNAIVGNGRR
jgi:hypothetical protein